MRCPTLLAPALFACVMMPGCASPQNTLPSAAAVPQAQSHVDEQQSQQVLDSRSIESQLQLCESDGTVGERAITILRGRLIAPAQETNKKSSQTTANLTTKESAVIDYVSTQFLQCPPIRTVLETTNPSDAYALTVVYGSRCDDTGKVIQNAARLCQILTQSKQTDEELCRFGLELIGLGDAADLMVQADAFFRRGEKSRRSTAEVIDDAPAQITTAPPQRGLPPAPRKTPITQDTEVCARVYVSYSMTNLDWGSGHAGQPVSAEYCPQLRLSELYAAYDRMDAAGIRRMQAERANELTEKARYCAREGAGVQSQVPEFSRIAGQYAKVGNKQWAARATAAGSAAQADASRLTQAARQLQANVSKLNAATDAYFRKHAQGLAGRGRDQDPEIRNDVYRKLKAAGFYGSTDPAAQSSRLEGRVGKEGVTPSSNGQHGALDGPRENHLAIANLQNALFGFLAAPSDSAPADPSDAEYSRLIQRAFTQLRIGKRTTALLAARRAQSLLPDRYEAYWTEAVLEASSRRWVASARSLQAALSRGYRVEQHPELCVELVRQLGTLSEDDQDAHLLVSSIKKELSDPGASGTVIAAALANLNDRTDAELEITRKIAAVTPQRVGSTITFAHAVELIRPWSGRHFVGSPLTASLLRRLLQAGVTTIAIPDDGDWSDAAVDRELQRWQTKAAPSTWRLRFTSDLLADIDPAYLGVLVEARRSPAIQSTKDPGGTNELTAKVSAIADDVVLTLDAPLGQLDRWQCVRRETLRGTLTKSIRCYPSSLVLWTCLFQNAWIDVGPDLAAHHPRFCLMFALSLSHDCGDQGAAMACLASMADAMRLGDAEKTWVDERRRLAQGK